MLRSILLVFILLKLLSITPSYGQQFYRFKADFSIKEKTSSGSSSLVMGTVYYDKGIKKVVYDIKFPRKEIWLINGNNFYSIIDNKIAVNQKTPISSEQSIFNIALTGQLSDYGLKTTLYKLETVEKENNMVISTWMTEPKNRKLFGKIMMSHLQKRLSGLVFFDPANEILSKQTFKNYLNADGLEFPTEINQISYTKTGKDFRSTTYKKIVINENNNSSWYNYTLPK